MLKKAPLSKLAKYSIVASGYTGRLVCFFKFVKYNIVDGKLIRTEDTHKCTKECMEIKCNKNIEALFIYDKYWDEGLYASPDLDLEKYGDDITKILSTVNAYSGIIVYKNTKDVELAVRGRLNYCQYWDKEAYVLYDGDKVFAIYYIVNAESG